MITFYTHPMSSNAQKVRLLLAEKNLSFKQVFIDLARGAQLEKTFTDLNPFAAVPVIEDGSFRLAESNAILRYLSLSQSFDELYPLDLKSRSTIDMMLDFSSLHVARWVDSLNWNMILAPMLGAPVSQAAIEEAHEQLHKHLPQLESWMTKQSGYMVGRSLTIADISFAPKMALAQRLKLEWSTYPCLMGYQERILGRPAWKLLEDEAKTLLKL